MSWKDILKLSFDTKGNTYESPKFEEGVLGPAMALAEKRNSTLYLALSQGYSDNDGFIFDSLEEANSERKDEVITIKPTDKKTLLEGVSLYKKIKEKLDFNGKLKDQSKNALPMLVDNFFRGREVVPEKIYFYLDEAYNVAFAAKLDDLDSEKLTEQMQEILEELEYLLQVTEA